MSWECTIVLVYIIVARIPRKRSTASMCPLPVPPCLGSFSMNVARESSSCPRSVLCLYHCARTRPVGLRPVRYSLAFGATSACTTMLGLIPQLAVYESFSRSRRDLCSCHHPWNLAPGLRLMGIPFALRATFVRIIMLRLVLQACRPRESVLLSEWQLSFPECLASFSRHAA